MHRDTSPHPRWRLASVLVLLLAAGVRSTAPVHAAPATTASRVYGQPNFTSNTRNNAGIGAASLDSPSGIVPDNSGNLYVADTYNHRVLYYPAGSTTASRVYGQGGSFTASTANNGGISATSLSNPDGIALDRGGNLYVADSSNSRVLYYPAGSTTATRVYGQNGSFTSEAINNGGLSASSLASPGGVALDSSGNLYVADYNNRRGLEYADPSVRQWSGWAEVEPTGRTYATNGDATTNTNQAAVTFNQVSYLFRVGSDHGYANQVLVTAFAGSPLASGGWGQWTVLPKLSTAVAVAPVIYAATLYLFVTDLSTGSIGYVTCTAACQTAAAWSPLTRVPLLLASSLPPSAVSWNGLLLLFWVGTDHLGYWASWNGLAGGWQWRGATPNATSIPSSLFTSVAIAATVATDSGGFTNVYTFTVDQSTHRLYYDIYSCRMQCAWSTGLLEIGGASYAAMGATTLNGSVFVTAVGTDSKIYFRDFFNLNGWQEVGGGGTTNASVAALAVGTQLSLFATGALDGRVYLNTAT